MSATQFRAIELAIIPRAGRLPQDIALIDSLATLSFCPVRSVQRRVASDSIAKMISDVLVEAGV